MLRHRPDEIGINLDSAGWVAIDWLRAASAAHGTEFTRTELDYVVEHNDKQRFAISDDGLRIRASQGHSIDVALGYESRMPPELLYHGTAERHLPGIRLHGLVKGERHHVHLSDDRGTARSVGQRHGKVIVLEVRAGEMVRAGFSFYISANGVWLTEAVPYEYLLEPDPGTHGQPN